MQFKSYLTLSIAMTVLLLLGSVCSVSMKKSKTQKTHTSGRSQFFNFSFCCCMYNFSNLGSRFTWWDDGKDPGYSACRKAGCPKDAPVLISEETCKAEAKRLNIKDIQHVKKVHMDKLNKHFADLGIYA